MKRPYVFYFPCHSRSNGIRTMMLLSKRLAQEGFEVLYYVKDRSDWSKDVPVLENVDANLRQVAIAVYPEIVAGNPLRIRNVARLVLFYPGKNGGMKRYHESEMTFAYFPEFLPGADVLTIPWIDENLFNDPGYPRTQDCCFVHKGGRWKDPPELRDMTTITMQWPETREALADLLKRTRTLYSFDDCSAVLAEALICGAKVMIVTPEGYKEYKDDCSYIAKTFPAQFRNFVERTQSSDWKGRLQTRWLFCYWATAVWRYWVKPLFIR